MSAIQLFDLNGEQRFTGTSVGGVQSASITLTDVQIKALSHPTPIQVVAAPGDGYMLVVVSSVWRLDNTAGAYTNIAALALHLNYGATTTLASTDYDDTLNGAFADTSAIHLLGVFAGVDDGAGNAAWFADRARVNNAALMVSASNGVGGDMTGGNAANTLTVNVAYRVIPV